MRLNMKAADRKLVSRLKALADTLPERQKRIVKRLLSTSRAYPGLADRIIGRLNDRRVSAREKAVLCFLVLRLDVKGAGPSLLEVFRRTSSRLVAWEAAKALTVLRPRGFYRVLCEAAAGDVGDCRRAAAIWALGISEPRTRGVMVLRGVVESRSAPPMIRAQACEALGLIGATETVPLLLACAMDKSAEVRASSAYALGAMKVRSALPTLRRLAESDRTKTRSLGTVGEVSRGAIESILRDD